jgi:competence protein ComEA
MTLSSALARALQGGMRHVRLVAAAACFLLGALVLGLGLVARPAAPPEPVVAPAFDLVETAPAEARDEGPAELIVYVTGAVPRPDVYRLAPGSRVKDAVAAAGGLSPDAAAEQVNLAESLSDAAHIHIPAVGDAGLPAPAAEAPGLGPIDLNTASEADLEELPGVGKTLAARIVARRAELGPFAAVEDLREVTGVGERLYAQIAPLVTVKR